MDIVTIIRSLFVFNEETKLALITLALRLGFFLFLLLLSWLIGRNTPAILHFFVHRFSTKKVTVIYDEITTPLRRLIKVTGILLLASFSLEFIDEYSGIYTFLRFFVDLALIISLAWLASRVFRQLVRLYGINLFRKLGREVDELLLIFETFANVIIGFIAAVAFAQSQEINLVGLLARLGIGGLAVAFAAQKTLEQLLGTLVLYLDRPFVPGEYIRMSTGLFGRVESIGIRSTKIRSAAKGTLMIVPNSTLSSMEIENITRGKKLMVLLYLDFQTQLSEREQALVEEVIKSSTNSLFGIDPGSTRISLYQQEGHEGTRARISFFILGSTENSLQLRKRLLEIANDKISKQLVSYGINFTLQEPTIYVESPVTI
ncbi:MAG: mechanosensitive ion channel family protein [Chroococcales cyanobacterium]